MSTTAIHHQFVNTFCVTNDNNLSEFETLVSDRPDILNEELGHIFRYIRYI